MILKGSKGITCQFKGQDTAGMEELAWKKAPQFKPLRYLQIYKEIPCHYCQRLKIDEMGTNVSMQTIRRIQGKPSCLETLLRFTLDHITHKKLA